MNAWRLRRGVVGLVGGKASQFCEFKLEAVNMMTDRDVRIAQASRDLDVKGQCFGEG